MACRGQERTPEPPRTQAAPGPRALRDVVFARTPERVERGRYLAEGILQCFVCHSERDWTQPGAPPVAGRKGAGVVWWDRDWLVAPNLTPDLETGAGRWSDDMLARAIREGIGHDGRVLHPQMWYSSFRRLADEDVEAVVAYLRTLAPVRNPLPPTRIPPERAAQLEAPAPLTAPVPPPDPSDALARGRYLVVLADCMGCHTSWYTPRVPGLFAGGNLIERPSGGAWSTNLTRDPSGIPYYDAALFREVMRTGRVKARVLDAAMPWIAFRHLSDEDLDAIFAYLTALWPVRHSVGNLDPPSDCAICGGKHPLGSFNRPRTPRPISFDVAAMADCAGRYELEDGFPLALEVAEGKLLLRAGEDSPAEELFTEDGRHFQSRDGPDVVECVRDASGRVTHLVAGGTDPARRVEGGL